jgi:hypothetical protein
MQDARTRITTERVQLTTDGLKSYVDAVEDAFGADVDYAMLVKVFRKSPDADTPEIAAPGRHHDPLKEFGTEIVPIASADDAVPSLPTALWKSGRSSASPILAMSRPALSSDST